MVYDVLVWNLEFQPLCFLPVTKEERKEVKEREHEPGKGIVHVSYSLFYSLFHFCETTGLHKCLKYKLQTAVSHRVHLLDNLLPKVLTAWGLRPPLGMSKRAESLVSLLL